MSTPTTTWEVLDLVPTGTSLPDFFAPFAPADADPGGGWTVRPVDYPAGSPATGALLRVTTPGAGRTWSAFVKVVNHLRHWPVYPFLPPDFAEEFAAGFDWKEELVLWERPFTDALPPGLRVPRLFTVADLGDDRLAIWMEDVDDDTGPWAPARYRRAAHLLGRFTARRTSPEVLASSAHPAGFGLRKLAFEGLPPQLAGGLDDDALWTRPELRDLTDLRDRLLAYRERLPPLLADMDSAPQAMPHGDASPQNLLVPAGPDPAEFVVIDCAFQTPQAVGFDLGQLLVGLVQAGTAGTGPLPALRDEIVEAFLEGYSTQPAAPAVDPGAVRAAFATTLLVRSGFTALPLRDLVTGGSAEPGFLATRAALTRFVLDTADAWCS